MSYGTAKTIFQWTDYGQRNPIKYTITAYKNNVSVDSVDVYTEQEMEAAFAAYRKDAEIHKIYDQVVVTQAAITVPSTVGSD